MKDPTNSVNRRILKAIAEFLLLSLFSLLVPIIVATDIRYFSSGFHEILLTELSQELLLGISAILFAIKAYQCPASRGFLSLVAGMFLTVLIRESDAYLDRWVYHSFWGWPGGSDSRTEMMAIKSVNVLAESLDLWLSLTGSTDSQASSDADNHHAAEEPRPMIKAGRWDRLVAEHLSHMQEFQAKVIPLPSQVPTSNQISERRAA